MSAMAGASRKGEVIHIQGIVTHKGDDRYDFSDSEDAFGAYELQESGRGKPFRVRQNWKQEVVGTVDILGSDQEGKLILGQPHFDWKDLN